MLFVSDQLILQDGARLSDSFYNISFTVTDKTNLTTTAFLTINVTDVNEPPEIFLPNYIFVEENFAANATLLIVNATDMDKDVLQYFVNTTDNFNIDQNGNIFLFWKTFCL